MPLRIKPGFWPAGGYPYTDQRTGQRFDGMSADLLLQARNVIKHRMGNPRFYPQSEPQHFQLVAVMQEITDAICKQNPAACCDSEHVTSRPTPIVRNASPAAVVTLPSTSSCPKCGSTTAEPLYCRTCSGKRLLGYKCATCGTERSK